MKNVLAASNILMHIRYPFVHLIVIMLAPTWLKGLKPARALCQSTGKQTMPLHRGRGLQVGKTETKNQPSNKNLSS